MSALTSGHEKVGLLKKGQDYSATLGLAGAHEGIILVMLERGYELEEAEQEASALCFQGGKIPLLSKTCRDAINSVVEARWTSNSLKAQKHLIELALTAANPKVQLDAIKTLLDRAGHGPVPVNATEAKKPKTIEELRNEAEELRKIFEG